jgi:hypothetical protein
MQLDFIKRPSALTLIVLVAAAIGITVGAVGISRVLGTPAGFVNTATTQTVGATQASISSADDDEVAKLVSKSHSVLVGTVLSNECRLSPDKQYVLTDYRIEAREVFKGKLKSGDATTVSVPGGLILFHQDGSEVTSVNPLKALKKDQVVIVSVTPPDEPKVPLDGVAASRAETPYEREPMMNGQSYLLFLVDKPGGGFVVTSGERGTASGLQGVLNNTDLTKSPKLLDQVRSAVSKDEKK